MVGGGQNLVCGSTYLVGEGPKLVCDNDRPNLVRGGSNLVGGGSHLVGGGPNLFGGSRQISKVALRAPSFVGGGLSLVCGGLDAQTRSAETHTWYTEA